MINREHIKGVVTVTITGGMATGKTIIANALHELLTEAGVKSIVDHGRGIPRNGQFDVIIRDAS